MVGLKSSVVWTINLGFSFFLLGCAGLWPPQGTGNQIQNEAPSLGALKQDRFNTITTTPALNEIPQFKPRVLLVKAMMDEMRVPKEWQDLAEADLTKQITESGVFVILKPGDVGLHLNDFIVQGQWDFKKLQTKVHEKAIPLLIEWELAPLEVSQEADSIGIARERRRTVTARVSATIRDTRKKDPLNKVDGRFVHNEKEVLWWSRKDEKIKVSDFDRMSLELFMRNAIANLVPQIVDLAPKISWSGRVAMIKGDRLYINVGQQSGVMVGDILKVLDKGDEVFDPESGESIGKVPGRMKGTLEVINYFGADGAIAVVHSGAGFLENDAVEYY